MRKQRLIPVLALAVLAALVLAACSSGTSGTTTTTAGGGTTTTAGGAGQFAVTIKNLAFNPAGLTVPVGSTVTWTNEDGTNHTVTSDTGLFDSGQMATGDTFQFTFTQAGVFAYHCTNHSNMTGTITVTQ